MVAMLMGAASNVLAGAAPESTQLPILFKLLTYDRTLWEDRPAAVRLGILQNRRDPRSAASATAMEEALAAAADKTVNGARIDHEIISWSDADELARSITEAAIDVLYVTPGHGGLVPVIALATRSAGMLSLADESADVEAGLSVGLTQEDGRPRLMVNLEALGAEGHQLDARVLRICRVVSR